MPSIIGTSYPVSAMVPSVMPVSTAATDNRQPAQKPVGISSAESSRVLSDRVTAFLSTNQAALTKGPHSDGSTAGQGPRGTAPRDSSTGTGAASTQLEEAGDDTEDGSAPTSATGDGSILLDEAKIYRPSSLY